MPRGRTRAGRRRAPLGPRRRGRLPAPGRDGARLDLRSSVCTGPACPATGRVYAESLTRRARLDGPVVPRIAQGDFGLTGRETEVLRLVALGHTNREIANELYISVKTASVHVSNILRKVGAATRGEAGAIA